MLINESFWDQSNGRMSTVYFTKEITPEVIVKLYNILGRDLKGNVAIKIHSGEPGNQNYIKPIFYDNIINLFGNRATIVESNVAYESERNNTDGHWKVLEKHGWTRYKCDILDSEGEIDIPTPTGSKMATLCPNW